jgi:hypothetical protein
MGLIIGAARILVDLIIEQQPLSLFVVSVRMNWILYCAMLHVTTCWSEPGHTFAASVAHTVMKSSTRFWVHSQIGGGYDFQTDLRSASVWADQAGSSLETDEYHFVHTPYRTCGVFVFDRDCGFGGSGKCLVSGIAKYIAEAVDESRTDRSIAVKMLIHLIADLFQPLHSGFAEDHGGNDIDLTSSDGGIVSLHTFWDRVGGIEGNVGGGGRREIMRRSSLDESILSGLADLGSLNVAEWVASIVTRTTGMFTCGIAYQNLDGSWINSGESLTPQYEIESARVALQLLIDAGVVLGKLLDGIADAWAKRVVVTRASRVVEKVDPNPYHYLSIDDFEFDPVEVVAQGEVPAEEFVGGKIAAVDLVSGFDVSGVRMIKFNGCYVITSRDRARELSSNDASMPSVVTYRIEFPRNTRSDRIVELEVDRKAFPVDLVGDIEFVEALIFRLRGRRYAGRAIVPNGVRAPTVAREPSMFSVHAHQIAPTEASTTVTHFGTILTVFPNGTGDVALSDRDQARRRIRQSIAATEFPELSSPSAQMLAFMSKQIVEKRCSEIVRFITKGGRMVFLSSISALKSARKISGSPLRVWGTSVRQAGSPMILVFVDQNILEEFESAILVQRLLKCAADHRNENTITTLRPTLEIELDQMFHHVTKTPALFAHGDKILDRKVFLYKPPICGEEGVFALEWKLSIPDNK